MLTMVCLQDEKNTFSLHRGGEPRLGAVRPGSVVPHEFLRMCTKCIIRVVWHLSDS